MQPAVLVIQMGALGDFVLSLRIAAGLRAAGFPQVAYLCRAGVASWAVVPGGVDELLDIETGGFHRLFGDAREFGATDWPRLPRRFDVTINMLGGGPRGLCGARLTEWSGGRVFDLDPRPRPERGDHMTAQWLDDLSRAGLSLEARTLRVMIPDEYRCLARKRLAALGPCSTAAPGFAPSPSQGEGRGEGDAARTTQRLLTCASRFAWLARWSTPATSRWGTAAPGCVDADVAPASEPKSNPRLAVLHVGSGGLHKCWPLENFLKLSEILRADGWDVIGVLGPVERDTWPAERCAMLSAAMPTLSDCSLTELAGLCAEADLYIGNDSGATHLASAVGAPTVAIFGSTSPRRWSPIGLRVCVVDPRTGGGTWPSVVDVANAVNAVAAV